MYEGNVKRIQDAIGPDDLVLDIGGWAQPFRRANYVIDAEPYETRGFYASIGMPPSMGDGPERFSASTWIRRDICSRDPFPFRDKEVDYVICSHTLEDVRDPLYVCSEIIRIGKRGYIEVPSRLSESILRPATKTVGSAHHRWLVTIGERSIVFEMKYHLIHAEGLHFPASTTALLREDEKIAALFWEGSFDYAEAPMPHGLPAIEARLRAFVDEHAPALARRR